MKIADRFFLVVICLLSFFSSISFAFDGPLQVKNQYPIFLHVNQPYLEKASSEDSLSMSLSHSSTYTVQSSNTWDFGMDMEITELNLRYKKNVKSLFEIGIDVPIFGFSEGFMDGFLGWYHEGFGFPDYGRKNRPLNDFLYEVRKDGNLVIKGETGMGLGDIRLAVKKPLISSEGFWVSIKGDVEFPTGSAKKGYGNGSLDTGITVLIDKSISQDIMTYWNIGYVFTGDLEGHQKIKLKDFVYGGVSVEADAGKAVALLAQLQGQLSIYPKTDLLAIDRNAYLFSIGGRYRSFEISFTEDINTSGAPDFILNLSYKIKL
ncbi:MAG: DUF3187 family protein [Nitrospirae bacterium]|nr:DUF3187 family protein [Nitrospirota bacterium]